MNKNISRKFVFSSMVATSILLILLIGTINVINLINTNNTAWNSLEVISGFSQQTGEAPEERPDKPVDVPGQEPPAHTGRNAYDTYMASNFFVVEYSSDGDVAGVDVSRTSRFTDEEAMEMAEKAMASGKSDGREGKCIFNVKEIKETGETIVVFLDTSASIRMVLSILAASVLAGTACWLLMLLITVIISRRVTKPIAESFEKQKQFITDAGHEYKTPLAIIQSNADAMELHTGGNKWLSNIKQQISRLTGLTEDMLLLAKMDEGSFAVRKANVNVSEVLREHITALEQQFSQREMKLRSEMEENLQKKCSREDMDKIIGVLLDNSLKYGRQGGYVAVGLEGAGKVIRLSVENDCDELPDVPPEKLFERFYRSDKARNQEKGGSGIGLSIAKAVAESYGGSIRGEYPDDRIIKFTVEI